MACLTSSFVISATPFFCAYQTAAVKEDRTGVQKQLDCHCFSIFPGFSLNFHHRGELNMISHVHSPPECKKLRPPGKADVSVRAMEHEPVRIGISCGP